LLRRNPRVGSLDCDAVLLVDKSVKFHALVIRHGSLATLGQQPFDGTAATPISFSALRTIRGICHKL